MPKGPSDQTNVSEKPGAFLSYKREDEELIRRFYNDIRLRGIASIWMDREGIGLGSQWLQAIERAIREHSHLVVFLSPKALKSKVIKYEYTLAHELGKKIIPVILGKLTIPELPELLQKYHIELFVDQDGYEATLLKLVRSLPRSYILPKMVFVPAGPFIMGGPGQEKEVVLPEFWIAETSVSVAEYVCFTESGGYEKEEYWLGDSLNRWRQGPRDNNWPRQNLYEFAIQHRKQPMRGVTWYEAYAYCQWLSYVLAHPFMLPTEAQWEKAARGTDARKWAIGNEWQPDATDVKESSIPRLDPKDCGIEGSESPFGCRDMIGQVWNWTLSTDPPLPSNNDDTSRLIEDIDAWRIIRGGSWCRGRSKATTYHWESQNPIPSDYRLEIGFRIATVLDPTHLPNLKIDR